MLLRIHTGYRNTGDLEGNSKIHNRFSCGPRHTFSALLSLAIMTHGWIHGVNLNAMDYVWMDVQYDS